MKKLQFTLLAILTAVFLFSFSALAKEEAEGGSHSGGLGGVISDNLKNTPFNNALYCSNAAGSLKLTKGRLFASGSLAEYNYLIQSYQQISTKQIMTNKIAPIISRTYYIKVLLVTSNIVEDMICEQPTKGN